MAIHEQGYAPWEGRWTTRRWRFVTLSRFAWGQVFASRAFLAFYAICFALPVGSLLLIYLHHNLTALTMLNLDAAKDLITIDAGFFGHLLHFQSFLAWILILIVAPSLLAPDLAHGALSLLLSRPLTRHEYVMGKFAVLAALGSTVTWIPLMVCWGLKASLEPASWGLEHLHLAAGLLLGSMIWITVVSLLALAITAWVRWKPLSRAAIIGVFLFPRAIGRTIDSLLDVRWGGLIDLHLANESVWYPVMGLERVGLPSPAAAAGVLLLASLIALIALWRKIRPFEVVR